MVLDLSAVELSQSAIAHLVASLEQRDIRILGIEGVDAAQLTTEHAAAADRRTPTALVQKRTEKARGGASRNRPRCCWKARCAPASRSCFTDGDVTVLGSVGSGAEIVAGGSIHIYGTLRGRAMAGVNGNSAARIFCQKIEAELLAIDGYYQTAEDIDVNLRNRPAQAWLDGDTMKITPLN